MYQSMNQNIIVLSTIMLKPWSEKIVKMLQRDIALNF